MIPKCVHPLDQLHDDACELVGELNSSSYRFFNFNFQNGYIEDWLTSLSKSEISAHLFHRIAFWGGLLVVQGTAGYTAVGT